MNATQKAECARIWVATDNAFSEKDATAKQTALLAVRAEIIELAESVQALRNHFDVDLFDTDKTVKTMPAVSRIRAKKGEKEAKTGNPFA